MPDNRGYPSGIFSSGDGPPDELALASNREQAAAGNDPSWLSGPYLEMSQAWQPIKVCIGGTQAFRENCAELLPIEPKENEEAWQRRVSHAVLSPFTTRIADQAAGLILRKPIQLEPKEENGEVDPYWEEFAKNVDGYGTDLDSYARRIVLSAILFGHSATIVDYPTTEPAPNLAVERALGLRPYFLQIDAPNILGWRKDGDSPIAPIGQIRINEYVTEDLGLFGDEVVRQIRILEPGKYQLWRRGEDGWALYEEGVTSLPVIPMAVTYSNKVSELISKPPLLPIANLNILQAQRMADLQHSLHVAALPILVLKGFDDTDNEIGLSANSAILMGVDGAAEYVEPASSAFASQQAFIAELEHQMQNLGISTLFSQKMGAETAEAKSLSRADSDSLLAIVSKDLQASLQIAFDIAAQYAGIEAPSVQVNRDFDLQTLEPQQVTQYLGLWQNGAITHQTLLEMLQLGEVLPHIDVQKEIEMVEQEKLVNMDIGLAGSQPVAPPEVEEAAGEAAEEEQEESEVAKEVKRRLALLAADDDDE